MQESKAKTAAFLSLTTLVVLASGAALAFAWPYVLGAARAQSSVLVGEAASAPQAEALTNYQLAVWLDPASTQAKLGLAGAQIKAGQAAAAMKTLETAGQGSEAADLRLRADIELGRTDAAAGLAQLMARQSSPEAAQALRRAEADSLPLATELYAAGLPESSSAILRSLPVSFERNLLLGRINYDRHTTASLESAIGYLEVAVNINPSHLEARKLYAAALADTGHTDDSAKQQDLIKKLELGQP